MSAAGASMPTSGTRHCARRIGRPRQPTHRLRNAPATGLTHDGLERNAIARVTLARVPTGDVAHIIHIDDFIILINENAGG
jgi:hypothetical protein